MSVEGMWAVYFNDASGKQINSGIAVLETGRIFGGDSMMAYLGNYVLSGSKIVGNLKIWAYNPHQFVTTAFGNMGTPQGDNLTLEGIHDNVKGEMTGHLWVTKSPSLKISARLVKVAELPN